ncbi:hypothetical protein C8R45DRAFT_385053 [Mycena sanguinolenta]|nr:hypothetical protein C8R45DRAFT_385053 [Mycena sanguinolenta]
MLERIPRICWIRRSTARLCIEFSPFGTDDGFSLRPQSSPPQRLLSPHDLNQESSVIASLGYPKWYDLCSTFLSQFQSSYISVQAEVHLGSIIYWPSGSQFEHAIGIASVTDPGTICSGWKARSFNWLGKSPRHLRHFVSSLRCGKDRHLDGILWKFVSSTVFD